MLIFLILAASPDFVLAGVHLNDPPMRARDAIERYGYRVVSVKRSDSYRQQLLSQRAVALRQQDKRLHEATNVSSIDAVLADQRVTIRFDDDTMGRRVVVQISYVAADLAHSFPTVRSTLLERYGAPMTQRPQSAAWCVKAGDDCDAGGIPSTDMLAVSASNEGFGRNITIVELQVGRETTDAWRRAHEADLRQLMKSPDSF